MNAYKRVLGNNIECSILSGSNKGNSKYTFATIQTLSKDNVLNSFDKEEFDYIVFDEVHRIAADSYKKVYNYFNPKFLLGMTATPERTDGADIYQLFEYNIAYEIRLQEAMKEELICPFHYYGVTDLVVNGLTIEDNTDFNKLVSNERIKHILDKIKFYGYSGNRVKGLVFVSRKEEAISLSKSFNELGYRTRALSGSNSQQERSDAVSLLEQESYEGGLDYIFTVDIFNEGIDIPAVNQVVMLRPTQSSIIFIQQLGRGLRKYNDKEHVVVIDFIGNYTNNFLIPIALSGDNTYNKDNIRRFVSEGSNIIPGASTISFEKIVKERIFKSIDKANFEDVKLIRESYFNLKNKIGKIPSLSDYSNYGSIDIMRIISKFDSYHSFLKKVEKEYDIELSDTEDKFVNFISLKYLNGKRPHELEMIKLIIDGKNDIINSFRNTMISKYPNLKYNTNTQNNIINQMTQTYQTGTGASTFKGVIFLEGNSDTYVTSDVFSNLLNNNIFKEMIIELISYGLERNELLYSERYKDTSFKLYEKYTYDDVFRLLDWDKGEVALNVGGYKHDKPTNTFPIFINYDKHDEISDTIKYEDELVSTKKLKWISKSKRTMESPEIKLLQNIENNNVDINLFIRKNKDDKISKEFYYLGKINPDGNFKEFMLTDKVTAVEVGYNLENELREDLFEYIAGSEDKE